MMSAVLVSGDMMISSRIMSAAKRAGVMVAIALSLGDLKQRLTAQTRLVMFDLSHLGSTAADVVAAVQAGSPGAQIVAFGPHVDERLLDSARNAGCDVVMSNGQFHRVHEAILAKLGAG
jgi:hypothetical protein